MVSPRHSVFHDTHVVNQQHLDQQKSVKQHTDGWDTSSKVWSHMVLHMVLHLSHVKGDFGVTFNDITKDTVFYIQG
jgi:hypothetical protein